MEIQFCSDLHLEFAANREWLKEHPLLPVADILVIAGDTYYLERSYHKMDFIKKVADEFDQVYLIPGNHEYYGGFNVATAMATTHEKLLDNVYMVNNVVINLRGVQFIFSTMWTIIQRNMLAVMRGLVDFRKIKFNDQPFTINQYNDLHAFAWDFLTKAIQSPGKKVVVTHHLPSEACNAEEFKGSLINDAFCVDKTGWIAAWDIAAWIYGHSHRNMPDFEIEGTLMLTNQLGYVSLQENHSFQRDKKIEV